MNIVVPFADASGAKDRPAVVYAGPCVAHSMRVLRSLSSVLRPPSSNCMSSVCLFLRIRTNITP